MARKHVPALTPHVKEGGDSSQAIDALEEGPTIGVSGMIFPSSGVATIHYHDDLYLIDLSAPKGGIVKKLSEGEIATFHMRNLHLDDSRYQLRPEEIGTPPFEGLVQRLEYEHDLATYLRLIDTLLDPLEESSDNLRYSIAKALEAFLHKFPSGHEAVVKKIKNFIPPEEYNLRLEQLLRGTKHAKQIFEQAFPLVFKLLMEVQPAWQENARINAAIRITRQAIQENHDQTAETMSESTFRRTKEMFDTFTMCLADIKKGQKVETWKANVRFGEAGKLKDAKGNLLLYSKKLAKEKSRFEAAAIRKPHVLERYNQAVVFVNDSKPLLKEIESILGEIKGTNFLA